MAFKSFIFLSINLLVIIDCCEVDWYRINGDKCIKVYNVSASHDESANYCDFAYKASLLSIDSRKEQQFWSFYLFRYLSLTENVWIQPPLDSKTNPPLMLADDTKNEVLNQSKYLNNSCFVLQSIVGTVNQTQSIGLISTRSCNSNGLTICQLDDKKFENKPEPKIIDPNSEFFPNLKIKSSNGNETEMFTGLYYKIVSKYNNEALTGKLFGMGICSLNNNLDHKDCKTYYRSPNDKSSEDLSTLFMMTTIEKEHTLRLKRSFDTNELVSFSEQGLQSFDCFRDGVGSDTCDFTFKLHNINPFFALKATQQKGYYKIYSITNDKHVLGVSQWKNEYNETACSFYDDSDNQNNPRILFSFVLQNYSLTAQLYSIEWDKSIEEIIESNKQQISLIDTAVINNNSPASLNHEVSVEKKLTESFTTTFGTSMRFLKSMSLRDEISVSDSDTSSETKSFTKSASEAVSQSLSHTLSNTQTDSHSDTKSSNTEVSASVSASFMGIGASASVSHSEGYSSTNEHSNSRTDSTEESNSKTQTNEKSNTNSNENSKSSTKGKTNSTENTNSNERTRENSYQVMTSKEHTYRLSKIVEVPPYSAVKISSYANWISDMKIQFKLNIKFTAKALRRKMDGKASNELRTVDSEVVNALLKFHNFPGDIIKNYTDTVIGQITGSISASVGLDSVFSAKEINLDENVNT